MDSNFVECAEFLEVTALMLCIRARLQSGRKGPNNDEGFSP
jgi:hypothetical protein